MTSPVHIQEKQVLRDYPSKVSRLEADEALRPDHSLKKLLKRVRVLYRMLTDRTFSMSTGTRLIIVSALLYFVIPLDSIPDYIPGLGYLDDAAVLGAVFRSLSREIDVFQRSSES